MRFLGKCSDLKYDIISKKIFLSFEVSGDIKKIEENFNNIKKIDVLEINAEKKKKSRSLSANAYAWVLIDKIAQKCNSSKNEIYELELQKYGTTLMDENGTAVLISLDSVIKVNFIDIGLHAAVIGSGTVKNKNFTHYRIIKGSSCYTAAEMSTFLNGIVADCHELKIDTITPEEIERILKNHEKHH